MVLKSVESIMFLARFAPENFQRLPEPDQEWGSSPIYHFRLYQSLAATGVKVICARDPASIMTLQDEVDFVYSIYNRANFRNSEIFVSSLCAYLGVPCLGAHANTRAIAEDKHLFKLLARRLQIATPNWVKIDTWDNLAVLETLKPPCIVKWRFGADSAGITPKSVAHSHEDLSRLVKAAQLDQTPVIVEEFVPGENITIGAIGGQDCEIFQPVCITTDTENGVQTYRQKKFGIGRRTKTVLDEPELCRRIVEIVAKLYGEMRPLDYFRVDFRYTPNSGALELLELNAICNLHPDSTFALSARKKYRTYDALVHHILKVSLNRQGLFIK